jgi:uncharacterized protein
MIFVMFSLLSLLDDIAATLDDVAVMTKVAIKKTSALMSDDLAVNAGVVHGVNANRELPIVKQIFIGSLLNKVYCTLGVLFFMAVYEPVLKVILFLGGLYLSYEGAHKVYEKFFHKEDSKENKKVISEKEKIKGAVRTDLILSIEIIVIAKNSLSGPMLNQILSLVLVGLLASIIIYGLVAFLVKIDDFGLYLINKDYKKIGNILVQSMPYIMKGLGLIGTLAMFLVGGGIIMHTFHFAYLMPEILQNLIVGFVAGVFCVMPVELFSKLKK